MKILLFLFLFLFSFCAPVLAAPAVIFVAIKAAVSVVASSFLAKIVVGAAISFGFQALSGLILGKPGGAGSGGFAGAAQQRLATVRQPITSHKIVYGEVRTSGTMVFFDSTEDKKYHHMVVTLAAHEVEEIGVVWINETAIHPDDIDGSGNVTAGRFSGKVRIKKHLGATNQTADADLVSDITDWTSDHRGREVAYIYMRFEYSSDLFPGGIPSLSALVKGKKLYDPRTATTAWSPNSALATYDYLTNERYGRGASSAEMVEVSWNSGANISDEFVTSTDEPFTVTAVDTSADTLQFDEDILALFTGDRVQLTTSGTLPTGLSLATNYYVIVDFTHANDDRKIAIKLATSYANALTGTNIDITGSGSGTHTVTKKAEPRYTANGTVDTEKDPNIILTALMSSFAGSITPVGGGWKMNPGAWVAPTIELDEDDFISNLTVDTKLTKSERANQVIGIFSSQVNNWQPSDYPLVKNALYISEDNSRDLRAQLDLELSNRPLTCQRIAKIALERARQEMVVQGSTKLTGYQIAAGENVQLTNALWSFSSKEFEVTKSIFSIEADDEDALVPKIGLVLRETASGIYDWAAGEETTFDLAPNTGYTNPFVLGTPTGLMLDSGNSGLFVAPSGGTVISRIKVSWTDAENPFILGHEIQYKKSADSSWETAPFVFASNQVGYIYPVEDGVDYDVRIYAIGTSPGAKSTTPATSLNHTVTGKTEVPSDVTTFSFEGAADGTRIYSWTHDSQPADVRVGGGYKIRYKLGATTDWSAMTDLHTSGLLQGNPHEDNQLAAGTYTLAIKAVDSSDNESANAVFISSAVLPNPRIGNALIQRNERVEGWDGTKVDCFVNPDGDLEADGDGDWTDLPADFDTLVDEWHEIIDNISPITYTTPTIDLGADFAFTPLVSVLAEGTVTTTMQTGTDADGAPTGSFVTLGKITARYIKIKISVAGTDPYVSSMSTILDAPATTEDFGDIDTSDTTANVAQFEQVSTGRFKIETKGALSNITSAKIVAIQGLGVAGYSWALLDKDTTLTSGSLPAAEFIIWDETLTPADAIVDIELKGSRSE